MTAPTGGSSRAASDSSSRAEDRLAELRSKIDAFFARVRARYPADLACAPGCADCCRRDLTVTPVEAAAVARAVRALDPASRADLARRARAGEPCVALSEDGRCAVYEARPIVCRSHGVPIRYAEPLPGGKRALPVLDACFKNFTAVDLAAVDPDCVLDQHTLSVLLGAVDALHAQELAAPGGPSPADPAGSSPADSRGRPALRDVILAAAAA